MNRRSLLVLVTLLALGCGRGDSGKTNLAFISNNPHGFWTYAERGCQAAAKRLDIELHFKRPQNGTAGEQRKILDELLVRGVQGVAISPNDPGNIVTYLRDKVAPRIALVTTDNDVPDMSVRRCYIGTHNYRAGRAAGALVKKAIPEGGKIAIFVGQMDATNAIERRQGVLDYLAGIEQEELKERTPADARGVKFGAWTLVETRTDDGQERICQEKAQELLQIEPELACLVGLWEYNPPALLRAVAGSQKKPAIVGFDENFQTLDAIRTGHIVGTVVQDPFRFGFESMTILAGLVRGDESVLKNRKDVDAENRIYIPHRIVWKGASGRLDQSDVLDVETFYPELKKLREPVR